MTSSTSFATHPFVGAALLLAAACGAAGSAGCLSRSPFRGARGDAPGPNYALAPSSGGDRPLERPTRTFQVDSRLMRSVFDQCQYIAHLHGTVAVLSPRGAVGIDAPGTRFEPRLQFDAWMACPGQAQPTHTTETLASGRRWTADELAQVIAERGALAADLAGRRCTVRPEYAVRGSVIVGYAAEATCAGPARGGGPAISQPPGGADDDPPAAPPAGGTNQGVPVTPPKPEPGTGFHTYST